MTVPEWGCVFTKDIVGGCHDRKLMGALHFCHLTDAPGESGHTVGTKECT